MYLVKYLKEVDTEWIKRNKDKIYMISDGSINYVTKNYKCQVVGFAEIPRDMRIALGGLSKEEALDYYDRKIKQLSQKLDAYQIQKGKVPAIYDDNLYEGYKKSDETDDEFIGRIMEKRKLEKIKDEITVNDFVKTEKDGKIFYGIITKIEYTRRDKGKVVWCYWNDDKEKASQKIPSQMLPVVSAVKISSIVKINRG